MYDPKTENGTYFVVVLKIWVNHSHLGLNVLLGYVHGVIFVPPADPRMEHDMSIARSLLDQYQGFGRVEIWNSHTIFAP